jgi:uncharacterized iron-regulated membrane protein
MTFRKILFWLHLIAGVVAGVIIFVMSATGVALAFEKEIIAWAERDVRRVTPSPADVKPLGLDVLLAKVREQRSNERPTTITLEADPTIAVAVGYGRTNAFYVNPYSGEIREQGAKGTREFMHVMIDLHRYLGGHEEKNRALGKAINGACNVAFLFLAVSGLYLWWPRQWTKKILAAVGLMNFKLRGKARDFNWHNAVGLWCAPVLIVLTATAMPISYRWAGDLIYKLTGSTPPATGAGPGGATPAVEVPTPPPGSRPLGMEVLFAAAQKEFPNWQQIAYRAGGRGGARPGATNALAASTNASTAGATAATTERPPGNREENRERMSGERTERRGEGQREGRSSAQPVTLTIKTQGQWPLFATTQLTLDPYTGNVLKKEGYSNQNLGRQVRSWTRFLHTGEALGVGGKFIAGLASAGALLLVWTGFALTWRRFFSRAPKAG